MYDSKQPPPYDDAFDSDKPFAAASDVSVGVPWSLCKLVKRQSGGLYLHLPADAVLSSGEKQWTLAEDSKRVVGPDGTLTSRFIMKGENPREPRYLRSRAPTLNNLPSCQSPRTTREPCAVWVRKIFRTRSSSYLAISLRPGET
jgi:hypothetical protein